MNISATNSEKLGKLQEMVDNLHKEAEIAARDRETEVLLETTNWLRRARELQTRYSELASQADKLVAERLQTGEQAQSGPAQQERHQHMDNPDSYLAPPGGKARADECRAAYFSREASHGRKLKRIRRGYYEDKAGVRVGVTYSTEDQHRTWPWFLNLQDGKFDEAVLLCGVSPEAVQVIRLPQTFFGQHLQQMSRDQKGQVKFNIARRNGRFLLKLCDPGGPTDITPYAESEPLVCPRPEYE